MNKAIIEKFLKNNPLDSMYNLQISLDTLMISSNFPIINFSVEIDSIKSMGINYKNIFFESEFGKFEFMKEDSFKRLKRNIIK